MRNLQIILTILACAGLFGCASTRKAQVKDVPFQTTQSGITYKILKDAKGKKYPQEGDQVEIFIKTYFEDSLIFDSKTQTSGTPVKFPVKKPSFHGDLMEAFTLLTPGDSGIFLVPVDTLVSNKQNLMPWMEKGKSILYSIEMVSVKTAADLEKEKQKKTDGEEIAKQDDATLAKYFKKKKLEPKKTRSGLYYIIRKKTNEEKPIPGQTVTVNYTGRLMNGNVFDSNTDPQFNHVEPFSFPLGRGAVIRGWDEGIALLKKGEKATLFIPSQMAYGANSPTEKIPPHSILIFDVELVDFK